MNIFYKSLRIGKKGKLFWMWKFRTMEIGTDKISHFARTIDYTKHGHFLRKYKLDELPQLWNILKGEMNLIGPRPEEPASIAVMPQELRDIVLSIKPGLTDLASLYFYDEEQLLQNTNDPAKVYWQQLKPAKLLLQVFYIRNRCLLLKLAILWLTIKKILLRK